jgi:predicted small secreted protein
MMKAIRTLRIDARSLWSAALMGTMVLLLLSACHTTAGFGQDLQSVGRNVENSANKNNK